MKPLSKKEWENIKQKEKLLNEISSVLKVNSNQVIEKLNKLISENDELRKEIKELSE